LFLAVVCWREGEGQGVVCWREGEGQDNKTALVQQQGLLVLAAILFVGFWRCSQQHLLLLLSLTFQ
jgi:hypothetical protein